MEERTAGSADTVAQFTGTCRLDSKIADENAGQVHLLVPGIAQVKVLQRTPFWSRPGVQEALRISLGALGCVLALCLAWALGQCRRGADNRHAAALTALECLSPG